MTFTTLLVANRGEVARRIIRGARASGLRTIAIFTPVDARAPFVSDADVAVPVTSYLDLEAILAVAALSGADAVHPGYGYLSEKAEFASAVLAAGLTWIGPPPEVIAAMGDKLEAKKVAQSCGVATLPSSDREEDAHALGFPLMVKAAAGGGGKGMRIVDSDGQLDDALASARREAMSSFHDGRVFLERYIAASRHIEIQILGDRHGNVVHLGERECSIQRRHQKLVEESPSPIVDEALRVAMGSAALKVARAIGYESAGTVEFLLDDDTRDFYFLEVNARLQVEHPVTEEVTGIDLVREQLRIAQGEELGYETDDVRASGHAIEVRLCAEDPANGFLPATGTLHAFVVPSEPVARWENGVREGTRVTVDFDPLLAKVIVHASTRAQAARTLALALERLHVGGVTTNRDFLAATLRHERFLAGETTTDFIERAEPARALELRDEELHWLATAGALWLQGKHRSEAPVLEAIPSGWRNARLPRQHVALRCAERHVDVRYAARRDGSFDVGDLGSARIHEWGPRSIDVEINGVRRHPPVTHAHGHLYVQALRGTVDFVIIPRFEVRGSQLAPGGLNAPMPGLILDVRVAPNQHVLAGETLVVMEAMKMEHVITAPCDGTVSAVFVAKDEQVERDTPLLALEPDAVEEAQ
ncbi:MAG: biotin carboxylase N-terminal domain-containing protein [Acidimicrobiales bacterium]